jgi:hypothetical protein
VGDELVKEQILLYQRISKQFFTPVPIGYLYAIRDALKHFSSISKSPKLSAARVQPEKNAHIFE